jgi:hypothetical protein
LSDTLLIKCFGRGSSVRPLIPAPHLIRSALRLLAFLDYLAAATLGAKPDLSGPALIAEQ